MPVENDMPTHGGSVVLLPGEGKSLSFVGISTVLKAISEDTNGAWTLIESTVSPRFAGFKPHRHQRMTEAFYILEGTLSMQLDERTIQATPGSFVLISPGTLHTYANEETTLAKYLLFMSPGGFEHYLEELADMIRSEPAWPPADTSQLTALAKKYDATAE